MKHYLLLIIVFAPLILLVATTLIFTYESTIYRGVIVEKGKEIGMQYTQTKGYGEQDTTIQTIDNQTLTLLAKNHRFVVGDKVYCVNRDNMKIFGKRILKEQFDGRQFICHRS